jgi:hypothetical protein
MKAFPSVAAILPGLLVASFVQAGTGVQIARRARPTETPYHRMVEKVAELPGNDRVQNLANRRGLDVLNVLWEDTGRWLGSSVGPNISDVTIEVQAKDERGRTRTALMPVIRNPNFEDKTGDVAIDKLTIPVGNQRKDGTLGYVTLKEFLAEPTRFMTLPDKGTIQGGGLLAKRDSHVLVSAQATLLPVPKQGTATFWPVIFNYQSTKKNPAVLVLLVTRQGTSMTIVDNARDSIGSQSWGQRLFFNAGGERAPLTAERLSAVKASGVTSNGEAADSLGEDANLLMIVQVPLKVRQVRRAMAMVKKAAAEHEEAAPASLDGLASGGVGRAHRSDVEVAVLGHGPELGPYVELDGLTIARDPRFPVRATIQFYQATSNGVLASADLRRFAEQIRKVYQQADYVGSLVVPTTADTHRPTNWDGVTPRPAGITWADFPGLVERAENQCGFPQYLTPIHTGVPRGQ